MYELLVLGGIGYICYKLSGKKTQTKVDKTTQEAIDLVKNALDEVINKKNGTK